jgi:hypothetical protein
MHLALAEHMHVYVIDRLATEVVAVHDDAKAVLATLLFGETLRREQDMAGECLVILLTQVVEGGDVFFWDDQKIVLAPEVRCR